MADITLDPDSLRTLERLVESFGLEGLVAGLTYICNENAQHCRADLGDDFSAKLWERDGATLANIQARLHK